MSPETEPIPLVVVHLMMQSAWDVAYARGIDEGRKVGTDGAGPSSQPSFRKEDLDRIREAWTNGVVRAGHETQVNVLDVSIAIFKFISDQLELAAYEGE